MKLKEEGYNILRSELSKKDGPFSKTSNVMLAVDLMEKGEEILSNQVTKVHLTNIIKVLCTQLEWTEESNEVPQIKNDTVEHASEVKNEDNEIVTNTQNKPNSQDICKFYRSGKCQYGKTGKKIDKFGKTCSFSHPQTCKKFENYGYKEQGCKDKKCSKLHLSLCKHFMRYTSCKFGEKCRYFHPKKLKNEYQEKVYNISNKPNGEDISYAGIVKRSVYPQSVFLGQPHPTNQNFNGQAFQIKQPFLSASLACLVALQVESS